MRGTGSTSLRGGGDAGSTQTQFTLSQTRRLGTMNKTFLEIPASMSAYAKGHGAQFDYRLRQWFVVGEVPVALTDFLPAIRRTRTTDVGPSCPKCGSHTVMKYRKSDGIGFWSCARFPSCRGAVEWTEGCATPVAEVALRTWTAGEGEVKFDARETERKRTAGALRIRRIQIIADAAEVLGSPEATEAWLYRPSQSLSGRKPVELVANLEGCARVEVVVAAMRRGGRRG